MRTDTSNPYVGLRPFQVDESLLFFGRNKQIIELLQQLHAHHFVAVVGGSGCGKSSLLRAGVVPALKAGYLLHDSDRWHIAIMRPGQNPLYNLAKTLLNLDENSEAGDNKISDLLRSIEAGGVNPLMDFLIELKNQENRNFFLLVDQFEELFRFAINNQSAALKDEAVDFVNLMLELSRQRQVPFFVVTTMRSDFMGDCTKFYGLPEAMNKSLFLVPKLNRVQMKMTIEGPAKLYGGKLNRALTSRLLNDVGKFEDELPLLQHTLMRIWDYEMNIDKSGELDMNDYGQIGGMQAALSKHADEALTTMDKAEFIIAKEIFQALTMIDEHGRRIRRPVLLSELVQLTGAKGERLLKIIERFIEDRRSFLIVNDVADTEDKVIDISHESLIREWQRLNRWMDEEAESASMYLRLAGAAELHEERKKDYLTGSELQLALNWNNKFKPSAVWANRYREGFDEALLYLEASEKNWSALQKTEEERKKEEMKSKKRLRTMLNWVGISALVAIIAVFATFNYKKMKEKSDEVAQSATKLADLNDSIAKVALQERDDLDTKLKLLAATQDSVNIIAQTSGVDHATSVRLNKVSENLKTVIKQSEEDIRKKDLQLKIKKYGGNKDMINKTLSTLQLSIRKPLSQDQIVDNLYFLNNTKSTVWTSAMIATGKKTLAVMKRSTKMGSQASNEMKKFTGYLSKMENAQNYNIKAQYLQKKEGNTKNLKN